MAIDWSLNRVPDIAGAVTTGYTQGREQNRLRLRNAALAQYGQDPNAGIQALLPVEPETAIALQRNQRQEEAQAAEAARAIRTESVATRERHRTQTGQMWVGLLGVPEPQRRDEAIRQTLDRGLEGEDLQRALARLRDPNTRFDDASVTTYARSVGADPNAGDFTLGSSRYRPGASTPYAQSPDPVVIPGIGVWERGRPASGAAPGVAAEPTQGTGMGAGVGAPPPPPPPPGAPDQIWSNMITRESGGRQSARSPVGAFGVAQLMPDTARLVAQRLGDPSLAERAQTDPAVNEQLGRAYFDQLREQFGSDAAAAAAYNAGPQAVQDWINGTSSRYFSAALGRYAQTNPGRVRLGMPQPGQEAAWAARIPYRETRDYVAAVIPSGSAAPPPANQTPPEGVPIGGGRLIPMTSPAERRQAEEATRRARVDDERLGLERRRTAVTERGPRQGGPLTAQQQARWPGATFMNPDGTPGYPPASAANAATGRVRLDPRDSGTIQTARNTAREHRAMADLAQEFLTLNRANTTGPGRHLTGPINLLSPGVRRMETIVNELTPRMRQGLPGAASDRDVAIFRGATVNIANPGETNQRVAEAALAASRRMNSYSQFLEWYAQQNGNLLGAQEDWDAYADANPLYRAGPNGTIRTLPQQPWRQFFGAAERPRGGRGAPARPSAPAGRPAPTSGRPAANSDLRNMSDAELRRIAREGR